MATRMNTAPKNKVRRFYTFNTCSVLTSVEPKMAKATIRGPIVVPKLLIPANVSRWEPVAGGPNSSAEAGWLPSAEKREAKSHNKQSWYHQSERSHVCSRIKQKRTQGRNDQSYYKAVLVTYFVSDVPFMLRDKHINNRSHGICYIKAKKPTGFCVWERGQMLF